MSTITYSHAALALVGALALDMFLVFGAAADTTSVFFLPLAERYHAHRAAISSLYAMMAIAIGLSAPIAGILLDRMLPRQVIVAGILFVTVGFLAAGSIRSLDTLVAAYALVGIGIGFATLTAVNKTVSNWFGERNGLVTGVIVTGSSLGTAAMTPILHHTIAAHGVRAGYLVLAGAISLIALPAVVCFVRPPQPGLRDTRAMTRSEQGLEVREALASRSFWLLALARGADSFAMGGVKAHLIPCFVDMRLRHPAWLMSALFLLGSCGRIPFGLLADRIGARYALAIGLLCSAMGLAMLARESQSIALLAGFFLLFGPTLGVSMPLALNLATSSFGRRRLGTLTGFQMIAAAPVEAAGAIVAGAIFDRSGSYSMALTIFAIVQLAGAVSALGCKPYAAQESPTARLGISVS
ncbi:MAG TPA: MFS transporter [Candidatus Binataceae bacterium]|nr:MFS transporter [Candidatus Binataceae bacterium]